MAIGKREFLVAQANLVWAGEKFDFEWYIETGRVVTPDPTVMEPLLEKSRSIAEEAMAIPEKERSAWLVARTLKLAKPSLFSD